MNIFSEAEAFNKLLNNWDVSNVTNMVDMFDSCQNLIKPHWYNK